MVGICNYYIPIYFFGDYNVFLNCIGQGLTVKRLNIILYYNVQE